MIETLRRSVAMLSPAARRRWMGLVALAVASSAVEAFGAGTIYALIKIIASPEQAVAMPVVSTIYGWLPSQEPTDVVISFTVLVGLFHLLKNLLLGVTAFAQHRVAAEGVATVSREMLRRYLAAPYPFHLRHASAELMNKTVHSVNVLHRSVLLSVVSLVTEVLVVTGIATVLLVAAPLATAVSLAALVLLLWVSLYVTRRSFRRWGAREHSLNEGIVENLQQSFGGIKEVKVLGRERFFFDLFSEQQSALARLRWLRGTMSVVPRLVVELVFVFAMLVFVTLVVARGDAGATAEIVPLLGLCAYAGFRIIPSTNRVLMYVNNVRFGTKHVEELYADFVGVPVPGDGTFVREPTTATPFRHGIVVDGVTYAYEGLDAPVLRDVHLEIPRGSSVGVVGATGAGKSTLINLLLGLLQPDEGRLLVDGVDVRDDLRGWQRKIGYVPQDPFLLDDTIRRNVAFGLPGADIDDAAVQRAVSMAQLGEFLRDLPDGLETIVGERGIRLSGGQKQRIAIARALYHQPEVLVFDEATSSLDSLTEREVTRAIDALHGKKTLVIIAHRLGTVRGCDKLVHLRQGRIDGEGSYDDLLSRSEGFRDMAAAAERSAEAG